MPWSTSSASAPPELRAGVQVDLAADVDDGSVIVVLDTQIKFHRSLQSSARIRDALEWDCANAHGSPPSLHEDHEQVVNRQRVALTTKLSHRPGGASEVPETRRGPCHV